MGLSIILFRVWDDHFPWEDGHETQPCEWTPLPRASTSSAGGNAHVEWGPWGGVWSGGIGNSRTLPRNWESLRDSQKVEGDQPFFSFGVSYEGWDPEPNSWTIFFQIQKGQKSFARWLVWGWGAHRWLNLTLPSAYEKHIYHIHMGWFENEIASILEYHHFVQFFSPIWSPQTILQLFHWDLGPLVDNLWATHHPLLRQSWALIKLGMMQSSFWTPFLITPFGASKNLIFVVQLFPLFLGNERGSLVHQLRWVPLHWHPHWWWDWGSGRRWCPKALS